VSSTLGLGFDSMWERISQDLTTFVLLGTCGDFVNFENLSASLRRCS
jgi:hypothetical protein